MTGLTWIHLSDWHQHGQEFDRVVVRDALMRDIYQRKNISPDLARVDFIVFSGDVASSGKQEEYQAAIENLFKPVLKVTGLNPDRLFIVPGNHDLDRTTFEFLPRSLLESFESERQVEQWLTNATRRDYLLEPFAAYKQFVSRYTGQESPDYASVRRLEIDGKRVALLGLNSALMAGRQNEGGGGDDFGKLIVGEPQIYESLKQIANDDVRIAVLHHPLNWLAEFDLIRIERYLRGTCHFILYGNEHEPRVVTPTGRDYVLISAGASYDRRDWASNYNFVHLDFESGRGAVYLRRWSDRRKAWIKDVDACDDGTYQFTLQISDLGMRNQLAIEPTEMRDGKPVTRYFVSYAHDDNDLKEKLLKPLKQRLAIAKDYCFEAWDDGEILAGERWHEQIQAAIARCQFGLLLVSPAFLGSAYIQDHELPAFVASNLAVPEPGKRVIPVALKPILFDGSIDLKGLERLQLFQDSAGKAFEERRTLKTRDDFATELFQEILKLLKRLTPAAKEKFDVFLCYNSQDKPEVIKIARQLQEQGLKPWLDVWELSPGLPWQERLEQLIKQIKSAAVFVGNSGIGPWQEPEISAFLRELVDRHCPIIPVLLSNVPQEPELPLFLRAMTWVDFRRSDPDPIEQLIWGITGSKPSLESFRQAERKKHFRRLLNELSAPSVEDRIRAVESLGTIELVGLEVKVAVSEIVRILERSKDVRVRQAAANTLGQMGEKTKRAVPTLIKALKDKDAGVRRNAAKALGDIGDEAALPALKEALKYEDDLIREIVTTALLKISSVQEQQLREQYSVWSKQIRQSLYELNSASLAQFPEVHRDFIQQQFRQEFDFLNLVFHPDTVTLEVSERERINGFSETWRQAETAMKQNEMEIFRDKTDRVTNFLCESLNFKLLDNSATQGQFYGRMIDASNPAFSLNIRSKFPVIYACHTQFNEEDVVKGVISLLNCFGIKANFFALLIIFSNLQELRQQVRESAYKNDFIVLTYHHLWDILATKAPIQQLTNCILEQIDLVFLSPYTVGGPVPEKMFFGRAEEEKTLLQNIARKDYVLLANRKSGKTSLLNKIYPRLQAIPNHQVFYCDLQAVNDYETFYLQLSYSYPELEEQIGKITEPSSSNFYKLALDIKQRYSDKKIVFIFDEVDEILAYDIQNNEQLFKTFRSLSQQHTNIRFIFSGTTTLVKRVPHPDSPFFNFCNPIKLGLLEEKAARELIVVPMRTLGVKFENEKAIVQRILSMTAQHPNIIQYICDELIQRINKKLERIIEEQDLDMVLASQAFYEYFERLIWGQSTALEKLIVYAMWSYPEFTESEVIEEFRRRGIPSEAVKTSLETLLTYSTLSKKNDKYFFTFREFAKLMEKRSDIQALTEHYQREVGGSET